MKKVLYTTTAIAFLGVMFVNTNANAKVSEVREKYYVQGDVGIAIPGHKKEVDIGRKKITKKGDNSFQYNIGGGYIFTDNVRVGLHFAQITDLDYKGHTTLGTNDEMSATYKQKIKSDLFMLNGYYDFATCHKFTPYVGLGAGMSTIRPGNLNVVFHDSAGRIVGHVKKSNNFAFNLITGLNLPLNDKFSVDFNYKYTYLGKGKGANRYVQYVGDTSHHETTVPVKKYTLDAHNLSLGLRYEF